MNLEKWTLDLGLWTLDTSLPQEMKRKEPYACIKNNRRLGDEHIKSSTLP